MKRYFHLAGILLTAAALFAQDPNQAPNIDPNQPPAQDPPARVARLSLLQGQVSFQPASVNDWTGATINYPITIGDHLYADMDSRAELQLGSTAIRLGATSALSFLNLDDRVVQMRLDQGGLIVRVLSLEPDEIYEIDTAQGAVTLLQPGEYRVDTDPDRNATMVTVRSGNASVNTNNGTFAVNPQQTAYFTGDGQPQFASANPFDALDQFSMDQDRVREQMPAPRYVSQDMPGWQDLERNGQWTDDREYGPVWRPRTVSADWAPYRYGHWAWVEPWGWTWIDDAPWGFAPFHYGRWVMVGGGWAWVPGRVQRRPVYAPALVAFVGGGAIAGVAWFPLGPREVFVPAYRVSPVYVNRVNVTTVNVTNITVINRTYVNRTYVTAVDNRAFVSAQPVHRAMFAVPRDVAVRGQVTVAASVAPQRISVMGRAGTAVNVPRPRAQVINRPVYAQRTPPPAPVPFAARQQALQANPGRPVDRTTIEQIRGTSAPVRQPSVRTLPPSNQTNSPQGTQFGRPRTNTPPSPTAPTQSLPDQPQPRQRNRPDFTAPQSTGGTPPPPSITPADRVERQQRMQRMQPPEVVAPATPAPARNTEQAQPQPRPRTRPEPAATTPPPATRQERPAAREEKPAPKRENRKREEKKEEK
jgi:hypothetical protein